jgi:hypothetical protein
MMGEALVDKPRRLPTIIRHDAYYNPCCSSKLRTSSAGA